MGVQQQQQIREARKSLYPVMEKEKSNGKDVMFVKDKLFIDCVEYKPPQVQQPNQQQQQTSKRCHQGHLKVLSWNVNGLLRKLSDPDFVEYIQNFQIIFMFETWLTRKQQHNLEIEGYKSVHIFRNKSPNT